MANTHTLRDTHTSMTSVTLQKNGQNLIGRERTEVKEAKERGINGDNELKKLIVWVWREG